MAVMKNITLLPILLAFLCGLLYLLTAGDFFLWLDAPRFVAAIVSLGVPNPPEPLFLILAKPFTFIPFGSYIFRLQIFTALTSVLALIVLYKLILLQLVELGNKSNKTSKPNITYSLAAFFGTGTLAFSYQFWSQSQNIETFILVILIEVVILYLVLTAKSKRQFFINFCLIALLMGLATGTNPVIASIIPSILWIMWHRKKNISIISFPVWIFIGLAAIILVHLYIPIRANANPFLNYWRAQDLAGVWSVSTGSGLNVFVPELGRINGFTGSPEIFFKSTFHFLSMWLVKFTPLLLPFIVAGAFYFWKKNKFWFIFWFLIVGTNWLFSSLYFSGNQESWFLVSDIAWVVMAAVGFLWLVTVDWTELTSIKYLKFLRSSRSLNKNRRYFILLLLIPLIFWMPWNFRRGNVLTEDYIKNLYKPIGSEKAILFGSSDLYDSISFYVHDVPGTSVYRPNVIPITDNLLYILKWYRDNLKATTDLKIPDDATLKYDSADEYSRFANDFFAMNIDRYKIYITTPAMRNNFLQAYKPTDPGGSLKVDENRFKLVPQGTLFQVVKKEENIEPDPKNFEYSFRNGLPKNRPRMLEQTYNGELIGIINEYAFSLENLGDLSLKSGKTDQALKLYQQALDFNPKNAEIISRLGNYYGSIGDHAKAAEYFEKALKIEPRNIGLFFNLAIAYENTGKTDKAIANLNKVLQYAKGDSQIGQLAKARLEILKSATPSGTATSSGIQQQLIPQTINGLKTYTNALLNLQFSYPVDFQISEGQNGVVKLSNNLTGKDELTFQIFSRKLNQGEDLDSFGSKLPFVPTSPVLITQPVQIPGFQAIGKTYATGAHLTFILLLQVQGSSQAMAVEVYPGDTSKSDQLNQIIQTIKPIK